ncbi:MAG: hypothetical protein M3R63_16535 [Actinomycetota bacterium]|nr:hypothetical protein [Actinomycetota bacterium]
MAEADPDFLAAHLLRGVRVASWVIATTILLGLALPNVLAALDAYRPAWLVLAWFVVLLAVALVDGLLVLRRRSWGPARWPVAAMILAVSGAALSAVPGPLLVTPADQVLATAGWLGVLLFADRSIRLLAIFVACPPVLTLVYISLAGRLDQPTIVRLLLAFVAIGGFQLAVGAAARALRRVAAEASAAAVRQSEIRTAEAVAAQLHADRDGRYEALRDSVVPLLTGMADGSLRPADPGVRQRCAVEAARMRRLFAEAGDTADPLGSALAAVIDVAERRGVVVSLSRRGRWVQPPRNVREMLVDEIAGTLLSADGSARVTIGGSEETVTVSVVVERGDVEGGIRDRGDVRVTTLAEGGRVWVEARWTRVPAPVS